MIYHKAVSALGKVCKSCVVQGAVLVEIARTFDEGVVVHRSTRRQSTTHLSNAFELIAEVELRLEQFGARIFVLLAGASGIALDVGEARLFFERFIEA